MKITINQAADYVGESVTIGGWLLQKRGNNNIQFLQLRDGTGFMQGVVVKANDDALFKVAKDLTQESSMYITGVIKTDDRSSFGYEMEVTGIDIIQKTEGYPITPKEHGPEFLLDHRHLWLRSKKQFAVMNIRNQIIKSTYQYFYENGFKKIDPPILTSSSPEGTTELFHTKYFEEDAYLSQSGQLYAEAAAMAHGKVFTFGPTFRAEKSKTRRHLIEFWMIEPEMAFYDHQDSLKVQEEYVTRLITDVLAHCKLDLEILGRDTTILEQVETPFPRIEYTDAIQLLKDKGYTDIEWGDDFGAPHETEIANHFSLPVFILNYPKEIKSFYMPENPEDPRTVLCADLIAPEGYGEIIGGSERISDYDTLKERIEANNLDMDAYKWFLDLRKYGTVPHSGFGLGLERTVAWLSGVSHVRETAPFPRLLNRLYP